MDGIFLSRLQSGISLMVHFVFPGLTLGMALFILIAESVFLKTGRALYRDISAMTVRILALVFAFGVATGLVLPFAFGTNWAEFSKATGPLFGACLAVEGITAFTLEAVFIGVLLFGRNRVSRRAYWMSALLVFVGSHLSALIIIATNSWLQTPFHDPAVAALAQPVPDAVRDGFTIDAQGRYVLSDFRKVFFNPSTLIRFLHTMTASWLTGATFMLGVAAWFLARQRETDRARVMFRMASTIALVTALSQPLIGHFHIMEVLKWQGPKSPAMEGLFETRSHAPLYAAGWVDVRERKTYAIGLPGGLSLLEGGSLETRVEGLDAFPESEWPNVAVVFQAFHGMVMLGVALAALAGLAAWFAWRPRLETRTWLLRACMAAVPLPVVANECGWLAAEIGRQPWTVWKLMRTADAASAVPAGYVAFSVVVLTLVMVGLLALFVRFVPRVVAKGIH